MDKRIRVVVFFLICGIIAITLGKTLNPFDSRMFNFHDETQAARIQQMALNIKSGHIPPRLAPELSHNLGFPVFNFYAPFSYWVTTGLHLIGLPIPMALKFSFFLSLILSFTSMFLFLRLFFGFLPSVMGGITYASSLWFAIEIFVRGNLAECWFLVLFPLALYLIVLNSRKLSPYIFAISSLIISFTFTVHNVFSLLFVGIASVFVLLLNNKKRNFMMLGIGLLLSAYFLIPAVIELPLTYASQNAQITHYQDHFLCAWQIWSSPLWEFSGSAKGCQDDGMPFTLGKIHILLGTFGLFALIFDFIRQKKRSSHYRAITLFILLLGIGSLFLTTYQSDIIWELFKPILAIFQFPWRFLVFGMFSLGFFSAYFSEVLQDTLHKIAPYLIILMFAFLLFMSGKFFSKPWLMSYDEYASAYLSKNYVTQTVAYNIAEYLPVSADYSYWRSFDLQTNPQNTKIEMVNGPVEIKDSSTFKILKNSHFFKEVQINKPMTIKINIHYFPFWEIQINDKQIKPNLFDQLGRPIIKLSQPSTVRIFYNETGIEKTSNYISFTVYIFLCLLIFYKPLWINLKPILK
ncbi:hypothetical protein A2334_04170 [Candidatus Roizmanbacteria bacterium RIFOXYB2_FULL_38_10]|uniref:Membrane protein 6-pyruvoyl-tetrahydropterin synthase-related domain-containing protein n=1 Tax=Candidatus Roizmanbacteria bacterium RIFOXYD1_FULL_38_12 TaxID=1802093 RepID=A0A1F7KZI4_9BACT|nr:MAG: hypothetical protein A3K47_00280 [Candidatus Roizmanbacteria bacterium RIFOXYA2_FULL_38_14]OGK63238.1 MAG: hypothetical protein A3K27_00280 [Candidatus Roizmanbacteria bacterium RIFOXYA1_FULL_37_12]OGK65084.1 MAG: hypothetical protein A3K38_00280 [Candidatus Roizmanbacteria bacterium RIFOXYB1_FULL_40_23]OGK68638.1 MAG: hypothetical protein A2334_04170 [Candidatus Roizmanbacteria bacterium RIFOXYB2_FULL_38_10]OGK69488.1 MAG: hypothetical protein A3K21_00280 [Candidatus Roizmanbacteria ba